MQKRGQLSIFIILGTILILITGFFFYIDSITKTAEINNLNSGQFQGGSESAFSNFIESCVENIAQEEIDRALKQGGKISVNNPSQISFGIIEETIPAITIDTNVNNPHNFLNNDLVNPYFGTNVLPKLCSRFGQNTIEVQGSFSCLPELYGTENNTIQYFLEQKISEEIQKCFTNNILNERYDFELAGTGNVALTLLDDSLIVDINRIIIFSNDEQISSFRFSYPLRLKKIYSSMYLLVEREIRDIDFVMEEDYDFVCPGCFSNMQITRIKNYQGTNNDLFIVTDFNSPIETQYNTSPINSLAPSKHLHFAFLVENRRPYMDYIENKSLRGNDFGITPSPIFLRTVNLDVSIKDPDDDGVTNTTQVVGHFPVGSLPEKGKNFIEGLSYNIDTETGCQTNSLCAFKGGDTRNQNNYDATTIHINISTTDGNKGDYQTFYIYVNPKG